MEGADLEAGRVSGGLRLPHRMGDPALQVAERHYPAEVGAELYQRLRHVGADPGQDDLCPEELRRLRDPHQGGGDLRVDRPDADPDGRVLRERLEIAELLLDL